jgi:ABC-type Na+ efflux pump permease subunit
MMKRNQIESLLKLNGVNSTAPDEQIRSVLLSARYTQDEVDTAIMVLRQNTKTNETHVDGLHKVFRTNAGLRPNEISQLLGIDVQVSGRVTTDENEDNRRLSGFQNLIITFLSIVVAMLGLAFYMYIYKIGIFYPGSELF